MDHYNDDMTVVMNWQGSSVMIPCALVLYWLIALPSPKGSFCHFLN